MDNLESLITLPALIKLGQIILVDLVLAGDNAIVIGLVAAKFTAEKRRKVILYGVGAAVVLRIAFAVVTVQLLAIKGLLLFGGLLLLWVCWKLWTDLRAPQTTLNDTPGDAPSGAAAGESASAANSAGAVSLPASIMQIVVADLSMSLDNVLAVAGIADGHTTLLIVGLAIAVTFMIFAASLIAEILQKHRWLGYLGLAVIVYVGLQMTYAGALQLVELFG